MPRTQLSQHQENQQHQHFVSNDSNDNARVKNSFSPLADHDEHESDNGVSIVPSHPHHQDIPLLQNSFSSTQQQTQRDDDSDDADAARTENIQSKYSAASRLDHAPRKPLRTLYERGLQQQHEQSPSLTLTAMSAPAVQRRLDFFACPASTTPGKIPSVPRRPNLLFSNRIFCVRFPLFPRHHIQSALPHHPSRAPDRPQTTVAPPQDENKCPRCELFSETAPAARSGGVDKKKSVPCTCTEAQQALFSLRQFHMSVAEVADDKMQRWMFDPAAAARAGSHIAWSDVRCSIARRCDAIP